METLPSWLEFFLSSDDVDERCFEYLNPLNAFKARLVWRQIEKLQSLICPSSGVKKKSWNSKRGTIVGKRFERFFKILFEGSKIFTTQSRIQTGSSEIDLLISLTMLSQKIPFLMNQGDRIIGEAKCQVKPPAVSWVARLGGIMDTHSVQISILITACSSRKLQGRARNEIHAQAIRGRPIILIGRKQIEAILGGKNVLLVLKEQYEKTMMRQDLTI